MIFFHAIFSYRSWSIIFSIVHAQKSASFSDFGFKEKLWSFSPSLSLIQLIITYDMIYCCVLLFFLLFKFRVWCVYCALSCQIHTAPWLYPISVRSLFICICLRVRTFSFRVYGRIFQEAPSQILFPSSVSGHAFIRAFVILSSSLF